MDTPLQNKPEEVLEINTEDVSDNENGLNIYPVIRHLFLTVCILLAISIIIFLMYQNGKSIYDKGI